MRLRFSQLENASLSIAFTEGGSVSSSSSLSPMKFSLPTNSTPFSITRWRNGAFDLNGASLPLRRLPDIVSEIVLASGKIKLLQGRTIAEGTTADVFQSPADYDLLE